jgi:hypothetical protein
MKIAIIGSRDFTDYELLSEKLHKFLNLEYKESYTIISGEARGADSLAEQFAEDFKIDKTIFKADWNKLGKAAGFIRNVDIIENCDIVFAFWDGVSKGTKHSINLAKKMKKDTIIIYV